MLNVSGIVAIMFCGITVARVTVLNISEAGKRLLLDFVTAWAQLSELTVFLMLGKACFNLNKTWP